MRVRKLQLLAALAVLSALSSIPLVVDGIGEILRLPRPLELAGGRPGRPELRPEAIAIVDRYLEAIGGKKTFDAIQDRTYTFEPPLSKAVRRNR